MGTHTFLGDSLELNDGLKKVWYRIEEWLKSGKLITWLNKQKNIFKLKTDILR